MNGKSAGATLKALLRAHQLGNWYPPLAKAIARAEQQIHGDEARWQTIIAHLPEAPPGDLSLNPSPTFTAPLTPKQQTALREGLLALQPWRKGPFDIAGIHIDSEWRSDLKWNRLIHAADFTDKRVLDVGAGNGYYLLRALGAGAALALGIEPGRLHLAQFTALQKYLQTDQARLLPLRDTDLAPLATQAKGQGADIVLSMGVLYHRRDPLEHLKLLHNCLRPGGELYLESLVIDGEENKTLIPKPRYAGMRNVHQIPTLPRLFHWLKQTGFQDPHLHDLTQTTPKEQRRTAWISSHSLTDFLSPDQKQTIEGHPPPLRALVGVRG